jgi:hypothetical protein
VCLAGVTRSPSRLVRQRTQGCQEKFPAKWRLDKLGKRRSSEGIEGGIAVPRPIGAASD